MYTTPDPAFRLRLSFHAGVYSHIFTVDSFDSVTICVAFVWGALRDSIQVVTVSVSDGISRPCFGVWNPWHQSPPVEGKKDREYWLILVKDNFTDKGWDVSEDLALRGLRRGGGTNSLFEKDERDLWVKENTRGTWVTLRWLTGQWWHQERFSKPLMDESCPRYANCASD